MNLLEKIVGFSEHRKIVVAFGDHDPPEFQRQSREMSQVSSLKIIKIGTSKLNTVIVL